jgi:dolichyl-phosphate-mannose-protein mannosyltransferase
MFEDGMSPSLRLIYFLLLSLGLLSAWFGVQELSQVPLGNIQGLAMVGTGMLILAWVVVHPLKPLREVAEDSLLKRIAVRLDPLAQGMLNRPLIYAGMLVGGLAVPLSSNLAFQPWPVLIIWAAGILLFLVGTAQPGILLELRGSVPRLVEGIKAAKWELLAVLALTGFAFLCRGVAVGTIPRNFHGDEGEMGLLARAVLRGELREPFATGFLGHPTLWFFMQALSLRLFGNTIAGLRMLSALLGALAIPALYILVRPLYGRTAAILSAILLTFYHFHIQFSRIGLNNIADPLMMLGTLAAFFHGYRKRSLLSFALAGVLLGLAQYFYFGTRLILIVIFVLLVYLAIKERHRLRNFLGPIEVMGIGFFLSVGPLVRHYLTHPEIYFARMNEYGWIQRGTIPDLQANGQSLLTALMGHAYRSFGLFVTYNEHSPFYDSGIPLLSHGMELLFIVGLVLVLLNLSKLESFALLIWVIGTALFGGFLLWDAPQGQRYLIAAPALCILMALALIQVSQLVGQILGLSRYVQVGLTSLIVVAFSLWNLYFYFYIYTPLNRYALTPTATDIGYYLQKQTGQSYAYMFTPPYLYLEYATIKFVADDPPGANVYDPISSITDLPDPPAGLRPVFIFIPDRLNELQVIKESYPQGELRTYSRPPNLDQPYLYVYEPR